MNTKVTVIRHRIIGTGFIVVATLLNARGLEAVVQYYATNNDNTILEYESVWSTEQKALEFFYSIKD